MVQCPGVVHFGALRTGRRVAVVFVWYVLEHVLTLRNTDFAALDYLDPVRCDALVTKGSWLDDAQRNWQPEGEYMVLRCFALLHCIF